MGFPFGAGDFVELTLKRENGDTLVVQLGKDIRSQSVTVERMYGRSVLELVFRSDMSHVRYTPGRLNLNPGPFKRPLPPPAGPDE